MAVEANPALVRAMNSEYSSFISEGRLKGVHCALSDAPSDSVRFSVKIKDNHVSALHPSAFSDCSDFEVIDVPVMSIVDLIADYGSPYYIKIDLDGYDSCMLSQLFKAEISPNFLSAEVHFFPFL